MSEWFVKGRPATAIAIDDRAVQYGDGLFETIAIREARPRLWRYHLERLQAGCERLGIAAPEAAGLEAALERAVERTTIDTTWCSAKILVSAGPGRRGYQRPEQPVTSVVTGIAPAVRRAVRDYREGVQVRMCRLRLAAQPALAGIKTLNRLEQVLARNEWNDAAVAEGLLLDAADRVVCGTMSNVFAVIDNRLATPAITRCGVSGVMRRHVLAVLADDGVEVDVRDVDAGELARASELFLTNSQFGVLPVRRVGDRELLAGEWTRRVQALCASSGIAECRL